MTLYTIGFTKKSAREFFSERLGRSGAERLIDVRLKPSSQLAGFAKVGKTDGDFQFLLLELCGMDYVHLPVLAPDPELLKGYRAGDVTWDDYEPRYLAELEARSAADTLDRSLFDNAVLLCSEDTPEHCHRRLAAEYLKRHWGDVEIVHL